MQRAIYSPAAASRPWRFLPDLIRHREVLARLVAKDLKVRYRYALIGFAWAVLEPLFLTLILAFVFTMVFDIRGEAAGIDTARQYAALILIAIIPWQFFSTGLTAAVNSLVDNRTLIAKVSFMREVVPLAAIGVAMANFLIAFPVMLVVVSLLVWGLPGIGALYMLALVLIQVALVAGIGLLLACGNAYFRDISYMTGVALTFLFYASPVLYVVEMVPARFYYFYMLNPMACLIEAYRYCLIENAMPSAQLLAWPIVAALLSLVAGIVLFRRLSPNLADQL